MPLPKDLSELLGEGENPHGMVAQTPNGTFINGRGSDGFVWKDNLDADGARWNDDPRMETPILEPTGIVRVQAHVRSKRR